MQVGGRSPGWGPVLKEGARLSPRRPEAALPDSSPLPPHSYGQDDDIVFEDFARLRLKGLKDDKEDDEQFC